MPSPLYVPNLDGSNVYQNSAAAVDLSYTSYGFVKVRLITPLSKKVKVCIQAGGGTYYYDLKNNGGTESYPLQMGSGNYSVSVYENISGDSYSELLSKSVSVSLSSSFDPYLVPSQFINYSSSSSAVSIARGLVSGKSNNYERISAVLTYVATHISYDYALAKSVQSGYVPDIAADLSRGRGICFDYSAVSAAMLRSLGYPTKLMMGYVENGTVYHAWNEVYISGKGWVKVSSVTLNTSNWSRIDVTFISTSTSPETIAKYIGNSSNYKTVYTY